MSARYCVNDVGGNPCQFYANHVGPCRPIDRHAGWIPVPDQPVSEVADNLFLGSQRALVDPSRYDAVVTLHGSLSPAPALIAERRWHIHGSELPDVDALLATVGFVFYHWRLLEKRVLVRDQAGLNRAGLVVARTLISDCVEPVEAIEMVRRARSPYALCNERYVAHLLTQESLNDLF